MGMSLEVRAVIHFSWLKHYPNQVILSELEEVYCKDMILLPAIEKWTGAFDSGALSCPGSNGLVTLAVR
jgi:hypothetical protein